MENGEKEITMKKILDSIPEDYNPEIMSTVDLESEIWKYSENKENLMKYIKFNKENGIARITLNRPEKYNSFVRAMALEFQKALDDCQADKEVRVVYITGEGKAFGAGQDLKEATDDNGLDLKKIITEHYNPIIRRIRNLEKPVVAGINGVAAGASANIALACDITIAKESAVFIQAFSKIGLIPDSGGTFTLPRLVGVQKATAYMMLGEKVSAVEAERVGMIYKVVPNDLFDDEIEKTLMTLAQMPTKGLWLTKQALNASLGNTLEEQLDVEDKLQVEAAQTKDYAEGTSAFLEKRKPTFKGE